MLRFFVTLPLSNVNIRKNALAFILLLTGVLCLFLPLLIGNQVLFFGDISLYFTPLLHFQKQELAHGRIPLWNPQILCGTPFVGNPQAWPLYPTSLLLFCLSAERAVGIIGAVSVFWAALGTFAFLVTIGRSRSASLLGAVAWAFGGVLVSKMQFPNMVQAASWLPWLLLACEGVLRRPLPVRCAALGLIIGLALLAAHPQMFVLQFYLAGAWVVWRLATGNSNRRKALLCLTGGLLLGIGLAAAQLLPTLELVRHSVRPDLPLEKANRFILPPYAVLTNFLAPNFYGNPAIFDNPYVGRGNFWEPCCYLGVLPFSLFAYTVAARIREREVRFWLAISLLGIWLAVGRDAGLFAVAFHVLPGINRFHDAARFLIPATFTMACLAAHGLDSLLLKRTPVHRRLIAGTLLLLTMVDVGAFSRTLNPTMDAADFDRVVRSAPRHGASSGRLFHADEGKIWGAFVSYRTYEALATSEERAQFLRTLAPNLSVLGDWRDAAGYEPIRLSSIETLVEPVKTAARNGTLDSKGRILDALAVSRVAHWNRYQSTAYIVPRTEKAESSQAALWPQWHTVPTAGRAFRILTDTESDNLPLVVGEANSAVSAAKHEVVVPLSVMDIGPDCVEIRLPKPHEAGLVVLSDCAYPGWCVTIDGRPADSIVVNGAFRGVIIGKNTSTARWEFDSGTWRVGLFVSLLAVCIITSVAAAATLKSARRRRLAA